MAEKGYAGRVKNSGSQKVEATFAQTKKSNGSVKQGSDLRNGGSNKK